MRNLTAFLLALGAGGTLLLATSSARAQSCPAVTGLTLTCENGTCDWLLGENATNCPGDCLDRDTHVVPEYSLQASCPETVVFRPGSIAEAQQNLRTTAAQGKRLRVVGTLHTFTSAICVEGGNVIATDNLQAIGPLESYGGVTTVRVEAGAHIWDVAEYLHARGKALGYNIPGYGDISVAGFLAVGGHGSNGSAPATLSSLVVSIDKMGPTGAITTYDAANTSADQWRALRADLGLLGMTTSVRLEVRDQFNVRDRILRFGDPDLARANGWRDIANGCEYMFATYLNSASRLDVTCGNETTLPVTAPDASNELFKPDFPAIFTDFAVSVFQASACDNAIARLNEQIFASFRADNPWLEWTDAQGTRQRGTDVVGYSHRMVETTFRDVDLPWFSSTDWEVAIPESQMDAAWAYVKSRLVQYQLYNAAIGVVIRSDRANADTLLASSATRAGAPVGERLFYIEFPIYRPYELTPEQLAAYEGPYREMIQTLVASYGAQPHWGKNREAIFGDAATLASNADQRARFQTQLDARDPYGVFANAFTANAGFSWPQQGQDWVPVYYPGWAGKKVRIRNKQEQRCLQDLGGSGAETFACDGGLDQRFYLFRDGWVVDFTTPGAIRNPESVPQAGVWYSIRSVTRFGMCVDKFWSGGVHLTDCDNDDVVLADQLFQFVAKGDGTYWMKTKQSDFLPCVSNLAGSSWTGGTTCSDFLVSSADQGRKRWYVQP